jgi:hypothetical protein
VRQVRNATLGRSPLVSTLFLIWHVHCQSPPALALGCGEASRFCACCSTTAASGWRGRLGGMQYRGSCSRDGVQPTGILAGNERVWHRALPFAGAMQCVPGLINLLPGGLDGLQGTHSGDSRHGELDGRGWLDALGPLTRCPAQHRRDTRSHRISGPITSRMPVAWQAWVIPLFYCTVAGCRLCEGGIPRYLGY